MSLLSLLNDVMSVPVGYHSYRAWERKFIWCQGMEYENMTKWTSILNYICQLMFH